MRALLDAIQLAVDRRLAARGAAPGLAPAPVGAWAARPTRTAAGRGAGRARGPCARRLSARALGSARALASLHQRQKPGSAQGAEVMPELRRQAIRRV